MAETPNTKSAALKRRGIAGRGSIPAFKTNSGTTKKKKKRKAY